MRRLPAFVRSGCTAALVAAAVVCSPRQAPAQGPAQGPAQAGVLGAPPAGSPDLRAAWRPSRDSSQRATDGIKIGRWTVIPRDSSWWVPLTSLALPGTGQLFLGQPRAVAYFAMEAFTIFNYLNQHGEMVRERNRSQALAHDVARALFPGARPAGTWAYYEEMEKYVQSGVFTRVPGAVAPETDVDSYNGWLWGDLKQRYGVPASVQTDDGSDMYRRAINDYIERAVRDEYRWTWQNAELEQDVYRRSIRAKNQANRDAMANVRMMAANHLLSMLDAFVTLRLSGRLGANSDETGFVATLPWAPFGRPRSR